MPIAEYLSDSSIAEYLEITREIRARWPQDEPAERRGEEEKLWFRGQDSWEWGLSPKLYRPAFKDAAESEIRLEFQSQAVQLVPQRFSSKEWHWYFLMQHHRVPTRLLDWTENSLIALYFAIENDESKNNAAVWVLDPWWLTRKLRLGMRGPLLPDYEISENWLFSLNEAFGGRQVRRALPAPIEPPHVDRRVAAQSSRFLVFGTTEDLVRSKPVRKKGCRLARIKVPASARKKLKRELDDCGINASNLFPDLEGLAAHILWRWKKSS